MKQTGIIPLVLAVQRAPAAREARRSDARAHALRARALREPARAREGARFIIFFTIFKMKRAMRAKVLSPILGYSKSCRKNGSKIAILKREFAKNFRVFLRDFLAMISVPCSRFARSVS